MLENTCPTPSSLTTIAYNACRLLFGKDTRFFFQRLDDSANKFLTASNGIELKASWDTFTAASDTTKYIVSPLLEEVDFPEPEALEDSENEDGAPIYVGSGPQKVTAIVRNPTAAEKTNLRKLAEEQNLTVVRCDNKGNFGCRLIGSDHAGIKISSGTFGVKGAYKTGTSRTDQNKLKIEFYLPEDWFDGFAVVAPASGFDPLTEIDDA
jgi:hypothetical protein